MKAHSGRPTSAGIAQNGMRRRLLYAWIYGGSGLGGGGGGGAVAGAGVAAAAAGSTAPASLVALGAGVAPPSGGVARPAASRRARDRASRCSGTSVIRGGTLDARDPREPRRDKGRNGARSGSSAAKSPC